MGMPNMTPEIQRKQEAALHGEEVIARLPATGPLIGAEVGVWQGQTSEKLLKHRPELFLYMVDRWYREDLWPKGKEDPEYHRHKLHLIEAKQRTAFAVFRHEIMHMDSVVAAAMFEEASLDFVFVDADHDYAAVKADIAAWWSRVKSGGWLSGHDYDHPSFPGVRQAVDEVVSTHGWELELGGHWTWFVRMNLTQKEAP